MHPLIVPGTLDSLDDIGQYVLAAAAEAGLQKMAAYRLRLGVDEIATNIITYGYQGSGQTGDIEAHADIDEHTLRVTLEDTGPPFDPRQNDLPDAEDLTMPLEERPMGGLGVLLAFDGVDEFQYERVDGRNRNIFIVNRSTPLPAAQG